jgi:hypothetical protein
VKPVSEEPLPIAAAYTTVQPSGGPYKGSSIKEGFICAVIWAMLAASAVVGPRLWVEHAHPERGTISADDWTNFVAATAGQFLVMAVVLSTVVYYRRRKNVTRFILLDWRWWLACVITGGIQKQNALPWLWVGLIYQVRLNFWSKAKFPQSPATAV